MTLQIQVFENTTQLAAFVNANAVTHANIQQVIEKDGAWWLLFWA